MDDHDARLGDGLALFKQEFETKTADPDWHASEEGIRECLAGGLRTGFGLPPGSVSFERASGPGRIDLWVSSLGLAVELKFYRPIPSGHNRPMTQQYGALLADCKKLAAADAADRLLVLVADRAGATHMANQIMLPTTLAARSRTIGPADLGRLPATAARVAIQAGYWVPLSVQLIWRAVSSIWFFFGWRIEPA